MTKGRLAPPRCLFYVATQIENQHTLIEQSAYLALLYKHVHLITNTTQLYNYLIISLAIAFHDVYNTVEVYNVMSSLLSNITNYIGFSKILSMHSRSEKRIARKKKQKQNRLIPSC